MYSVFPLLVKSLYKTKSLEEVRDKLGGCYGEMPMDKIAEEMEQAFIAADLAGRFSILKKAGIVDG